VTSPIAALLACVIVLTADASRAESPVSQLDPSDNISSSPSGSKAASRRLH
jgi:hypothetical protein